MEKGRLTALFKPDGVYTRHSEGAFLRFCNRYRLPLVTFSAKELRAVPGVFAHSDFVQRTVGVDCVRERAAVLALGGEARGAGLLRGCAGVRHGGAAAGAFAGDGRHPRRAGRDGGAFRGGAAGRASK